MKIVRKIEDINEDCWCRLTKENFEAIKKLGIKTEYNDIKDYTEKPEFEETDVFYLYYYDEDEIISANWGEEEDLKCNVPEIKFELEEI